MREKRIAEEIGKMWDSKSKDIERMVYVRVCERERERE